MNERIDLTDAKYSNGRVAVRGDFVVFEFTGTLRRFPNHELIECNKSVIAGRLTTAKTTTDDGRKVEILCAIVFDATDYVDVFGLMPDREPKICRCFHAEDAFHAQIWIEKVVA